MDIKLYKKKIEEKIISTVQSIVNERVSVQAEYDLANDGLTILLFEEHRQGEGESSTRESLTVYNCYYHHEADSLSVAGFNRRYGYDAFGVAQIVNDPITVDENFMHTIRRAIMTAFQDDSAIE